MKNEMTIREVLEITIRNLETLTVPVTMIDSIGVPIQQNIGNLRECIAAIDREEAKRAAAEEEAADDQAE